MVFPVVFVIYSIVIYYAANYCSDRISPTDQNPEVIRAQMHLQASKKEKT